MEIRRLAHQEIDTAIKFFQAMLDAMASFSGHALQDSYSV
jgi:imidazoleglycerol phosphate dehydratase HisB